MTENIIVPRAGLIKSDTDIAQVVFELIFIDETAAAVREGAAFVCVKELKGVVGADKPVA